MTEMKKSTESLKNRFDQTEEGINEVKDTIFSITQPVGQKGKQRLLKTRYPGIMGHHQQNKLLHFI
jgi:hypothetical protein